MFTGFNLHILMAHPSLINCITFHIESFIFVEMQYLNYDLQKHKCRDSSHWMKIEIRNQARKKYLHENFQAQVVELAPPEHPKIILVQTLRKKTKKHCSQDVIFFTKLLYKVVSVLKITHELRCYNTGQNYEEAYQNFRLCHVK